MERGTPEYNKYLDQLVSDIREKLEGWDCHIVEGGRVKECPPSGGVNGIPKANAWLVWLINSKGRITDFQVYNRDRDNSYVFHKVYEYVEMRMGKTPYLDTGCVVSDWHEWSLDDVLFMLGYKYGFCDSTTMIKTLQRLSKIQEWEEPILRLLRQF